jgi:hypothetical protein
MKKRTVLLSVVFLSLWMTNALADLNEGLIGYWPFNGNADDESGHGNHGSINGAIPTIDRFGVLKSAYSFDGVDDRIVIPSSSSLNPVDQLTIAFWLNTNSITKDLPTPILHKGGSKNGEFNNREYSVWLDKRHFSLSSAGNNSDQHILNSTDNVVELGKWIFFTAVINRRNHLMKIYLNGQFDVSKEDDYYSFNNNGFSLNFGGRGEGASFAAFDGVLDEVRIYNRALAESEINALFNEASSGVPSTIPSEPSSPSTVDAASYEAGRQACINNPSSCGISAGSCDSSIAATYLPEEHILRIPAIEVPGPFLDMQLYKADMELKPSDAPYGFHFEVKTLEQLP